MARVVLIMTGDISLSCFELCLALLFLFHFSNLLLGQPIIPFGYDYVNIVTTFRNFANGSRNYY